LLCSSCSGTLSFEKLQEPPLLFLAGLLLVLSALGFKVASVPFHVWAPDVYEGAPTPVVAFFSVASKSAGFAALLRILFEAFGGWDGERRVLFSIFAAMTLLYGNLGALVQTDMKRLLGYSSIGHAGFLLMALAANSEARTALLYYLLAYAVTNLAAFLVVSLVENSEGSHAMDAFKGLARRSPFLAAGMCVALLSLAGVPPLGGFFAKFFILLSVARSELLWLVFLGAVNVAISLYYYLNVVRVIYFERPDRDSAVAIPVSSVLLLFLLMTAIVLIGVWQAPFFHVASQAASSLL
jgi:NADH-quinone oxidoreductase subunit N